VRFLNWNCCSAPATNRPATAKEQAAQIQKVNALVEIDKGAPQLAEDN